VWLRGLPPRGGKPRSHTKPGRGDLKSYVCGQKEAGVLRGTRLINCPMAYSFVISPESFLEEFLFSIKRLLSLSKSLHLRILYHDEKAPPLPTAETTVDEIWRCKDGSSRYQCVSV